MMAKDFEFDGNRLSSFGCIIVSFGDKGLETVDGVEITFNTVSSFDGLKHHLTSTKYESYLETTIQIAKHSCDTDVQEISSVEFREISSWLNRRKFLKFKLLDENHIDLYYMATVSSIGRIELDGRLMGLELHIITNSPHALKEPRTILIENTVESGKLQKIYNWSKYIITEDEIGEFDVSGIWIAEGNKTDENSNIYDDWTHVKYSDNVVISNDRINLINPVVIHGQDENEFECIIGKYIYVDSTNKYYRIPSDASIYSTINKNNITVRVTDAFELKILNGHTTFVEKVSSENATAYPYDGEQNEYHYVFNNIEFLNKEKCVINDTSYEEGYIYPYTEIKIIEDGNLTIYNSIEDRTTSISNCVAGEIITMDYPIIQSSLSSHNIQNDFNWNFFRVANTFDNSRNDLTISIPCKIKITYSPIVKVGL